MQPGRGGARLGRTALFSVMAVALAVTAHHIGGGSVSFPLAAAFVPLVMVLVNPLAGRRRHSLTVLTTMGLLQAGMHWILMTASQAADCHVVSAGHEHAASSAAALMQCTPDMAHAPAMGPAGLFSLMTLGHALAAAVLALVLARSDAAVWNLARWLGFTALLVVWTPLTPAVGVVRRIWSVPRPPQLAAVAKVVLRRGPPVLVFSR